MVGTVRGSAMYPALVAGGTYGASVMAFPIK
jgi:hypothetical protein